MLQGLFCRQVGTSYRLDALPLSRQMAFTIDNPHLLGPRRRSVDHSSLTCVSPFGIR